jgi:AcrR family transcriptional regulator
VPIVETDPIGQRARDSAPHRVLPPAPAKIRILETADRLFYDEGIRSVGIDRLISESGVTKATFYKHYGSKDRLILDYITGRHEHFVAFVNDLLAANESSEDAIRALVDRIVSTIESPGFRGCPFINAAIEFTDVRHPVRELVLVHRDWYAGIVADLFKGAGHPLPGDAGDEFILARDGAMMGGYVGDSIAAVTALQRIAERILADSHR